MQEEQIILDAVDKFLDKDVRPYAKALELKDEYPSEIVEKMKTLACSAPPLVPSMVVLA